MTNLSNYPQHPVDEPLPRFITIPDPAPGAEIIYNCPARHRFKLLSFSCILTTSVVVANRNVILLLTQGPSMLLASNAAFNHVGGLQWIYHFIPGQYQATFTAVTDRFVQAPYPFHLFNGQTFQTMTANLDVADQFSDIRLYAFSWPDFVNIPPA